MTVGILFHTFLLCISYFSIKEKNFRNALVHSNFDNLTHFSGCMHATKLRFFKSTIMWDFRLHFSKPVKISFIFFWNMTKSEGTEDLFYPIHVHSSTQWLQVVDLISLFTYYLITQKYVLLLKQTWIPFALLRTLLKFDQLFWRKSFYNLSL